MANPYHDKRGRFTTKSGGGGRSIGGASNVTGRHGRPSDYQTVPSGSSQTSTTRRASTQGTGIHSGGGGGWGSSNRALERDLIRNKNTKNISGGVSTRSVRNKGRVAATTRANLGGVSDNGASGGWGSGLVPGKKSDLGLRTPGTSSSFSRSVRATNTRRVKADNAAIAKTSRSNSKKK